MLSTFRNETCLTTTKRSLVRVLSIERSFFCSEEIPKNVLVRCKRNPCDPSFDGRKGSYARIRACIRSESWFVRLRRTWRGSISYPLSLGWGIPTGEDSPSLCIAEEEGSGAWDPPKEGRSFPEPPSRRPWSIVWVLPLSLSHSIHVSLSLSLSLKDDPFWVTSKDNPFPLDLSPLTSSLSVSLGGRMDGFLGRVSSPHSPPSERWDGDTGRGRERERN